MPRKRRQPKRRALPTGLAEISLCERAWWSCHGPIIREGTSDEHYIVWPDWQTWATFYGAIRDELFARRPWLRERSVADAAYCAWRDGGDPEGAAEAKYHERFAIDPRLVLRAA